MAGTVNGIGTNYIGKKNLTWARGVCEHCGAEVGLESYDTRLWFVIIFIPIIPLGLKKIIDYCPKCTYHRALSLAEWERNERESLDKLMREMRAKPDDAGIAIEMMRTLNYFGKTAQAGELSGTLETRFPARASILAFLGFFKEEAGEPAKAEELFKRAMAAVPADNEDRHWQALVFLDQGQPDRALAAVDHMKQAGPDQDPGMLISIAEGLHLAGDAAGAMAVYDIVVRDFPKLVSQDAELHKRIRELEGASDRKVSALPVRKGPIVKAAAVGAIVLLAVAILFGINFYIKTHQTLHVVNWLDQEAVVVMPDGQKVRMGMRTRKEVTIAEGAYDLPVRIDGLPEERVAVKVKNGWFERFGGESVFILNVHSAGIVLLETNVYSARESNRDFSWVMRTGQPFITFRDVDHIFEEFPDSISVDENVDLVKRYRVGLLELPPCDALQAFARKNTPAAVVLSYLEAHYEASPHDMDLVTAYAGRIVQAGQTDRAIAFLKKGLGRRPVAPEWHRLYQGLQMTDADLGPLKKEYDDMLAAEPDNSMLLYLRSRLCAGGKAGREYNDRALKADENNAYAWNSYAYNELGQGDFESARRHIARACELAPAVKSFGSTHFRVRLALKQYDALEKEALAALKDKPLDIVVYSNLIEVRALKDDRAGITDALQNYVKVLNKVLPEHEEYNIVPQVKSRALYLKQDYKGYLAAIARIADENGLADAQFVVDMETFNLSAAQDFLTGKAQATASQALLMYAALAAQGNQAQADVWLERGREYLGNGSQEDRLVADWFSLSAGEARERSMDLNQGLEENVIIFAALGARFPEQRTWFLGKAAQLNFGAWYPARSLRQIIEELLRQ